MGKKENAKKDTIRKAMGLVVLPETKGKAEEVIVVDSRGSRQIVIFADGADQKALIRAEAKRRGVSMSRFIIDTMKKEVLGVK